MKNPPFHDSDPNDRFRRIADLAWEIERLKAVLAELEIYRFDLQVELALRADELAALLGADRPPPD